MSAANRDDVTASQRSSAVAIIGLGGVFPGASNVGAFWDNICRGHVAITDVPHDRWDPSAYHAHDRGAADKTYSRIGGFLAPQPFDARRFRIPPKTLDAIDDVQKLALTAVADALADAGLEVMPQTGDGRAFDRERTAVIIGNSMGGEAEDRTSLRCWYPVAKRALEESDTFKRLDAATRAEVLAEVESGYKATLPLVTEDSMPGELSNCIAGRIANIFNFRGPNFTTDAACAASMAALKTAADGLVLGHFDVAIVGGADRSMDPPTFVKFSKIGALSAEISAPFDARASGFVMGEGVGILVLKRLADAERDGDRIYAVVRGIGAASDGKGKGMTAPNPQGQRLAIERAYAAAGISLDSVGLVEAHGTSTVVGDATEVRVLTDMLKESGAAPRGVPIGSVKSMIGHLKSASGAASLIKTALAIHHRQLPPSANFERAPDGSPLGEGYLRVNTTLRPWETIGVPRRAGVSAFGFGGTNFHVVLEEAGVAMTAHTGRELPKGPTATGKSAPAVAVSAPATSTAVAATSVDRATLTREVIALFAEKTGYAANELDPSYDLEADLGIDTIKQAEIFSLLRQRYGLAKDESFRLSDTATLDRVVDYVARSMSVPEAKEEAPAADPMPEPRIVLFGGATVKDAAAAGQATLANVARLEELGAASPFTAHSQAPARLGFVAQSIGDAREKIADAGRRRARVLAAQGVFVSEGDPLAQRGKIAFLFPGQGSQYLGMMRDLAERFPVVADTFSEADGILRPLIGATLSELAWPNVSGESETQAADLRLRQTEFCQPAMLAADVAMFRLFAQYGIHPDMVAGHSLGEYAACVAAGVLTFADALYAVSARGREMASVKVEDPGKMASVAGPFEKVEEVLAAVDGYVIAANKNCHSQTVIAGASTAVEAAVQRFATLGIEAREIPVSHAFHSAIVAPASTPLRRVLSGLDIRAPQIPILSNVDAAYYPAAREEIVDKLARQLESPVEFIAQIERMYADGARLFVEVGPRRAITGFVRNVLGDREHRALASNHPKRPGYEGLLEVLAALAVDGVTPRATGTIVVPAVTVPSVVVAAAPSAEHRADIVVSGMAVALPTEQPMGSLRGDPFASLLGGDNFIATLDEASKREILHKNVVRLDKTTGGFDALRDLSEVIQLAARLGNVDLVRDYGIDAAFDDALDTTSRMAIAVGIDALRDAGLPLVRRYRTTSTGKQLPDGWALPPALGKSTGIVFGSAFPGVDRLVEDLSAHLASRHAGESAARIERLVDELAATVSNEVEATRMREVARRHVDTLRHEAGLYAFSRKFLFRVLAMGHAQLAQLIGAQGPNTQVNSACASGPLAIGLARDWLLLDRCDRVLVVTADNVTSPSLLPYFGAGFLAAGAATVDGDVTRAAVPFGADRNGMILGAGASAFVLERDAVVSERGMQPIVDVIAAHYSNSAYHGTRLDTASIGEALEGVLNDVERATGRSRGDIARASLFMSHETYTPARGGSSAAEVEALRRCFGEAARDVLIANTKGYTGHPMGATIEDVVAIKALQRGAVPAIANLDRDRVDPAFADLSFSAGNAFAGDLAIRFAAGFGSQIAITAYRQRARSEARLVEPERYQRWMDELVGRPKAGLEIVARTLRVAEQGGQAASELGVPSLARVQAATAERPVADAAPVVTSEPIAAPSLDRAAVIAEIQALFATATGYDAAELDPAYNLEADLGIDTVKQAEVLGLIRQRYTLGRDEAFRLSDVQTLDAVVDYVLARRQGAAATPDVTAATAPQVESAPVTEQPADDGADATLLQELQSLFAQTTGYDVADLDPSYNLEADLGIDTVKQAEIFGVIRGRYGLGKDESFRLSDVQTLTAVATYVQTRRLAAVSTPVTPALPEREPEQTDATHFSESIRTWTVGLVPAAPLVPSTRAFTGRRVLVASELGAMPSEILAALRQRGAQVHELRLGQSVRGDRGALDLSTVCGGAPDDVIVLCAASEGVGDAMALGDRMCGVFALARAFVVARKGAMTGAGWMVTGRGTGTLTGDTALMTLSGLGKSLAKEWQGARCLTIDVSRTVPAQEAAARALDEFLSDGPIELGHDGVQRVTLRRTAEIVPSASGIACREIVATGGARGVTNRLLRELAQQGQRRFVILGRTGPTTHADSPITGLDDEGQKRLARERLEAQSERATPAAVGRWIAQARAELEVHDNLEALRALGSEVEFIRCDVADAADLRRCLGAIARGADSVDLVVHGSGYEASKWIADKDDAAFHATWAPKAQAALLLLEVLQPKRLVTMGSVAGRFGNAGQSDYAMANALLAGLAHVDARVLNIGWTAWDDVGMATRGSVKQVLETYGVELLPAAQGASLGAELALSAVSGDVVVAGNLGVFEATEPPAAAEVIRAWAHPFFDAREQDGGRTTYRWRLDLARHPGLGDHRIDGVPVLPAVIGIELMVQAAADATGSRPTRLTGIEFRSPLKLHRDDPVEAAIEIEHVNDVLRVALVSTFAGPAGRRLRREHFFATVHFEPTADALDRVTDDGIHERPVAATRDEIYARYFHGPLFQVLGQVTKRSAQTMRAMAIAEQPRWLAGQAATGLATLPYVREAGFQVAGLWEMMDLGRMALPAGIEELHLCGEAPVGEAVEVLARNVRVGQGGAVFDVWSQTADGRVVDVMRGYRTVVLRPLTDSERFFDPNALGDVEQVDVAEVQVQLDRLGDGWLDTILSIRERAQYQRLKTDKRRLDWLAGRLAAKRLVARLTEQREGAQVALREVTVLPDPQGAPTVEVGGCAGAPISITHADGVAFALASPADNIRPGIDIEKIEPRDASFARDYFTTREQDQAQQDEDPAASLTCRWATKEAVLKALGIGARVDMRDIVVTRDGAKWYVELQGEALQRARAMEAGRPEVVVRWLDGRVLVQVMLPTGAQPRVMPTHYDPAEVLA